MYWQDWWQAMFGRKDDWFPFAIGVLLLVISLPPFIALLLIGVEPEWQMLVLGLIAFLGFGIALGVFFTFMGARRNDHIRLGLLHLLRLDRTRNRDRSTDDMPPAVRNFLDC